MKARQMIEIENVKKANMVLSNLLERTRTENIGLGLFYGRPGLGKTRWAFQTAIQNGYIYVRLIENISVKEFMKQMLIALKYKHFLPEDIVGSKKVIYDQILDILQCKPNIVFFIDEIDYAFSNHRILATIRDFADQSLCTFVMVGMQDAKKQLLKLNAHYFDRCNGFCEFKTLAREDTELIINSICETELDKQTMDYIHEKSNGTMRLITKYLDIIEKLASKSKQKSLKFRDLVDLLEITEMK
jgi:Holliday junction resolvasome RuvABC ATP-dependent DNA helicase subunit